MFKFSDETSYPWKVVGQLAGTPYSFTAHFAFLDQDRIEELTQQLIKRQRLLEVGQDDPDLANVNLCAVADEVLVGWGPDVVDDDGESLEFGAAIKARFLQKQGVALTICNAWGDSLKGAKQGNSKASRGIG
jgi:hypothetical protein